MCPLHRPEPRSPSLLGPVDVIFFVFFFIFFFASASHGGEGGGFEHAFPDGRGGAAPCTPLARWEKLLGLGRLPFGQSRANEAAGLTVSGVLSRATSQRPSEIPVQSVRGGRFRSAAAVGLGRLYGASALAEHRRGAPPLPLPRHGNPSLTPAAARLSAAPSRSPAVGAAGAEPGESVPPSPPLCRRGEAGRQAVGFNPPAKGSSAVVPAGRGFKEDPLPHWLPYTGYK